MVPLTSIRTSTIPVLLLTSIASAFSTIMLGSNKIKENDIMEH